MTIDAIVADDDTVAVRVRSEGTNLGRLGGIAPATNKCFVAEQSHWYRVVDGKLREHWATRDDLSARLQLGVIHPPGRPRNSGEHRQPRGTPPAPGPSPPKSGYESWRGERCKTTSPIEVSLKPRRVLPSRTPTHGALMEQSGRNQWQPVANGTALKTAETSQNGCRGMVRRGSTVRVRQRASRSSC